MVLSTVAERLQAGSRIDALGCTVWRRYRTPSGYGLIAVGRKSRRAHKVAYELAKGPVPEGLELDHLCRNRACIDPEHLEAVTHRVNVLRGVSPSAVSARKTECIRGHEFTEANTLWTSDGRRDCRACHNARSRARRAAARGVPQEVRAG
ncbi:hypothetical protein LCGC14_2272920 [marine sediment metagenome]|uniref:HNH nuclease domain-containing protein n=1 Tax=marine sediment metagenome TaxID=412755 RepID=A0A0F9F8Y6_9ZZZZ